MESTVAKYSAKIAAKQISAHIPYDGKTSGLVVDPKDEAVPVDLVGFGAFQLDDGPFELTSGDREMVFLPMEGHFELNTGDISFSGSRDGLFTRQPERSNAQAIYIPPGRDVRIRGDGEMIYYSAPSSSGRPPLHIRENQGTLLRSGAAFWRRDVLVLVSPDRVSRNLTCGETYSPAGHWSGTPLHVHDRDDPEHGQSDHEEIYYHRFRLQSRAPFGAYGIQMLFNGSDLDESYIIRDRSVIAIPGVSHPVVSGPMSDHIYTFGLGGREGSAMMMYDIPEFKFLKAIGDVVTALENERGKMKVPKTKLQKFEVLADFSPYQWKLLESILLERGFEVS
ncbi:MAG: 5-deoxy-glucuronate isomerase [Spirochaetaceae bacterium]|nr:MAG: 5-deoxy-glucuronate isomerase [Spirochaetaceae bacterium]